MASTFDTLIGSAKKDLSTNTKSAVHSVLRDVLSGKGVNAATIGGVVDKTINTAMGSLLGMATRAVSSTISGALGKYAKNSPLGMVAGNVGASMLMAIISGKQIPGMTQQLTNTISQGITQELMMKLPKSITKTVSPSVLGAMFNVSLTGVVQGAVSSVVGAVVGTITTGAAPSGAANTSVPIPSMTSATGGLGGLTSSFSLDSISSKISSLPSSIGASLGSLTDSLGSSIGSISSALSSLSPSLLTSIGSNGLSLPAGLDMTKLTGVGGSSLGSLLTLSSTPIGRMAAKTPGLSASDASAISKSLASANANNPLGMLGGKFDLSAVTGGRPIAKDLTGTFGAINAAFGVKTPEQKQAETVSKQVTEAIATKVATEAKTDASKFNTYNDANIEKLTTVKNGFTDPTSTYPLPEYKGKVETNRLATGDVKDTIVEKKNADRVLGAQLPNGDSFSEPESPFAGKYPHNHVHETISGHVIEIDDTPGAERLHWYHKSGTYIEIDAIGNIVKKTQGSDYHFVDGNGYVSIHGRANVSVSGQCNVFIGGDANIEVHGNTYVNGYNDVEVNAAGSLQLTGGEEINMRAPNIYIDADNELHVNVDVGMRVHAKQMDTTVDTDYKLEVGNENRQTSSGSTHINTESNLVFGATGNMDATVTGQVSIKSSGDFAVDGSNVWLNSGHASPSSIKVADTIDTEYSNAHYLEAREHVQEVLVPDVFPSNHKDETTIKTAEKLLDASPEEQKSLKADLVLSGAAPAEILTKDVTPVVDTTEPKIEPSTKTEEVIIPPSVPLGNVVPPSNMQLSPHFTIADLSSKTNYVSQLKYNGFDVTVEQIVTNLQMLALNVLEPIYAAYPSMTVWAGFRENKDGDQATTIKPAYFGGSVILEFPQDTDYMPIAKWITDNVQFSIMNVFVLKESFVINISSVMKYFPTAKIDGQAEAIDKIIASQGTKTLKTYVNGTWLDGIVKV